MNFKILVCCHKDDIKAENEHYLPIHVGKSTSKQNLNITGDDTGDNISSKNSSYCELTGMYWAWKNLKNIDYIGLCHYRRYFDFNNSSTIGYFNKELNTLYFSTFNFNVPDKLKSELKNGCIVLPKTESLKLSLYTEYCLFHISEDLRTLEKIIENNCEEKYVIAFEKVIYNNNEIYPCNMFLLNWEEFDKYCNWLFSILEKVEKLINIDDYDSYQKRIFGFMAERLLNIYVVANNLNITSYPMVLFTDHEKKQESLLKQLLRKTINKITSNYSNPKKSYFQR